VTEYRKFSGKRALSTEVKYTACRQGLYKKKRLRFRQDTRAKRLSECGFQSLPYYGTNARYGTHHCTIYSFSFRGASIGRDVLFRCNCTQSDTAPARPSTWARVFIACRQILTLSFPLGTVGATMARTVKPLC
jgi:hypothetical protein